MQQLNTFLNIIKNPLSIQLHKDSQLK